MYYVVYIYIHNMYLLICYFICFYILYYIFYMLYVFILEFVLYIYIGDDMWDNILG